MANLTFSVVICTHNRSDYLSDAIASLRAQTYPAAAYEIIVVDNASTDQTPTLVEELQAEPGQPIRYVYEPILGLNQARNTGAEGAKGEIVAYIDDDALAEPDFLQCLAQAYRRVSMHVVCVGGSVELLWENRQRPMWLARELESYYSSTTHLGTSARYLRADECPIGANLSVRRQTVADLGGFPRWLGRTGKSLLSNGEVGLCAKIKAADLRAYYEPAARVWHKVPAERATRRWLLRRAYWQGISDAVLEQHLAQRSRAVLAKQVLAGLRDVVRDAAQLLPAIVQSDADGRFLIIVSRIASRLGRAQQKMRFLSDKSLTSR